MTSLRQKTDDGILLASGNDIRANISGKDLVQVCLYRRIDGKIYREQYQSVSSSLRTFKPNEKNQMIQNAL